MILKNKCKVSSYLIGQSDDDGLAGFNALFDGLNGEFISGHIPHVPVPRHSQSTLQIGYEALAWHIARHVNNLNKDRLESREKT